MHEQIGQHHFLHRVRGARAARHPVGLGGAGAWAGQRVAGLDRAGARGRGALGRRSAHGGCSLGAIAYNGGSGVFGHRCH